MRVLVGGAQGPSIVAIAKKQGSPTSPPDRPLCRDRCIVLSSLPMSCAGAGTSKSGSMGRGADSARSQVVRGPLFVDASAQMCVHVHVYFPRLVRQACPSRFPVFPCPTRHHLQNPPCMILPQSLADLSRIESSFRCRSRGWSVARAKFPVIGNDAHS